MANKSAEILSFSIHTDSASSKFAINDHLSDLENLLDATIGGDPHAPIAKSSQMIGVLARALRFSRSSATVLLTGESGTGKEVVARWIHQNSPRSASPYVRVNCAALPSQLIESELFGHQRGAFTGAVQARQGRLAAAGEGTVLLDEISEMDIGLQAKLLRVLEEEEFQPVGCDTSVPLRARFIATSNRLLDEEVRRGNFREDLFYRLNVLHLNIPPLRQRPEDISPLVQHFITKYQNESTVKITGIESAAMEKLTGFDWPGNTRQLRNIIHRACVMSDSAVLRVSDFDVSSQPGSGQASVNAGSLTLQQIEQQAIFDALKRHHGGKSAAASELGITTRTLRNKLNLYREQKSQSRAA